MGAHTTLARPYARAAFAVARQHDALAAWEQVLHTAASIVEDETIAGVLADPSVTDDTRRGLVAPDGDAPPGFDAFLALLVENDRLPLLPAVAGLFSTLKDEAEDTLAVRVRSASALEEDYRASLEESLARRFGKKIEMTVEVDEAMLGGAVIEAGDLVIDGSVRGKLTRLAARMQAR